MAKNRQSRMRRLTRLFLQARPKAGPKKQTIYSEPQFLFKERYLTKKGQRLMQRLHRTEEVLDRKDSEDSIWQKYGKNRYELNPNAKSVKTIYHADENKDHVPGSNQ